MKLYHVSEEPSIEIFHPRPSAQKYDEINGDVVFAISDRMLHNYLLPRNCPRAAFYAKAGSSVADVKKYLGTSEYVIAVTEEWIERIKSATLYLYELPAESFTVLDEGAGYYISYKPVIPISVTNMNNLLLEISKRNAELRIFHNLHEISDEITKSTLQYSIIRLKK